MNGELPGVISEPEEGFVDLNFKLSKLETMANGASYIEARGQHQGRPVAFSIVLEPQWAEQPIENTDDFFYWGRASLRTVGEESDAFVSILDELYGTSIKPKAMRKECQVAVVGLSDDPRLLLGQRVDMKLFFEHEDPERYAEVFLNIVAPEGRIELHEKDPEYRKPLILALMEDSD